MSEAPTLSLQSLIGLQNCGEEERFAPNIWYAAARAKREECRSGSARVFSARAWTALEGRRMGVSARSWATLPARYEAAAMAVSVFPMRGVALVRGVALPPRCPS